LPSCKNQKIKISKNHLLDIPAFKGKFKSFNNSNGRILNDSYLNCGGSIISFDFCPLGDSNFKGQRENQYIVISSDYRRKYHVIGKTVSEINIIQFWSLGKIEISQKPELVFCLLNRYGFCWDMEWLFGDFWLPLKNIKKRCLLKLGLLCCVHSDGKIRIWDIFCNSFFDLKNLERFCEGIPVFETNYTNINLWRIKINPRLPLVLGATTDGKIIIWDLTQRLDWEFHVLEMLSHKYKTPIRGVDWNPDNPYQFVTCGEDAHLRFWSIQNPFCSFLSHRSKLNPLMNVCWINGTGCVLITSERILNNDNLFGTRVFSIIFRPTMNLGAETFLNFRDYIPWSVDIAIDLENNKKNVKQTCKNPIKSYFLPFKFGTIHILVGYSNGKSSLFFYKLSNVFGKNRNFKIRLINTIKKHKKIPYLYSSITRKKKQSQEQEFEKDDENIITFTKFLPPLEVVRRFCKNEKKNTLYLKKENEDFDKNMRDNFCSVQKTRLNRNSPNNILQFASGFISGMIQIQSLKSIT